MQLPADGDLAKEVLRCGGVDNYLLRVVHDTVRNTTHNPRPHQSNFAPLKRKVIYIALTQPLFFPCRLIPPVSSVSPFSFTEITPQRERALLSL